MTDNNTKPTMEHRRVVYMTEPKDDDNIHVGRLLTGGDQFFVPTRMQQHQLIDPIQTFPTKREYLSISPPVDVPTKPKEHNKYQLALYERNTRLVRAYNKFDNWHERVFRERGKIKDNLEELTIIKYDADINFRIRLLKFKSLNHEQVRIIRNLSNIKNKMTGITIINNLNPINLNHHDKQKLFKDAVSDRNQKISDERNGLNLINPFSRDKIIIDNEFITKLELCIAPIVDEPPKDIIIVSAIDLIEHEQLRDIFHDLNQDKILNLLNFKHDPIKYLQKLHQDGWIILLYIGEINISEHPLVDKAAVIDSISEKLETLHNSLPFASNFHIWVQENVFNVSTSSFAIIARNKNLPINIIQYTPEEIFELPDN